jgi:GNAT superfamily N-acetyltransferase
MGHPPPLADPHVNDILIRPLQATDSLAEMTDLLHRAFARLGRSGLPCTCTDQSTATTARRASRGHCFVATVREKLVGTLVVERPRDLGVCALYRNARVASVHQFAVAPEAQGRGVGGQLLRHAEQWVAGEGYEFLALDTPAPAAHLLQFYERRGFRCAGQFQRADKPYRSALFSKQVARHAGSAGPWYSPHRHRWFGAAA